MIEIQALYNWCAFTTIAVSRGQMFAMYAYHSQLLASRVWGLIALQRLVTTQCSKLIHNALLQYTLSSTTGYCSGWTPPRVFRAMLPHNFVFNAQSVLFAMFVKTAFRQKSQKSLKKYITFAFSKLSYTSCGVSVWLLFFQVAAEFQTKFQAPGRTLTRICYLLWSCQLSHSLLVCL